jgi:glycosyltransferase involved in cell wall biosynthesis
LSESYKPFFSIIIPAFNRPDELRRALTSLVNQSFSEFEVIVCDDGSTDDIGSVASEYKDFLSIHYIRIENSGGPARPRNLAVELSRGKWISFLDSDDWWMSDRLLKVTEFLHKDGDIFYHPLKVSHNKSAKIIREKRGMIETKKSIVYAITANIIVFFIIPILGIIFFDISSFFEFFH